MSCSGVFCCCCHCTFGPRLQILPEEIILLIGEELRRLERERSRLWRSCLVNIAERDDVRHGNLHIRRACARRARRDAQAHLPLRTERDVNRLRLSGNESAQQDARCRQDGPYGHQAHHQRWTASGALREFLLQLSALSRMRLCLSACGPRPSTLRADEARGGRFARDVGHNP